MEQKSLLSARFIAPGVLIVLLTALFGYVTGVFTINVPSLGDGFYAISFLLPAFLYYATPFRRWVNGINHRIVVENNRKKLVEAAGIADDKTRFTWQNLKPIFYELVDEDRSLTIKSERIRANGFVWTTFADATAISFFFALLSLLAYFVLGSDAYRNAFVIFVIVWGFGVWGSFWTTREQIRIADEQLDVMRLKYADRVKGWLDKLPR